LASRTRSSVSSHSFEPIAAIPPLPADYYRRQATRVRQLASDATTAAVKDHLNEVAMEYERLAERVDGGGSALDF
jgi:hypothetical protein